MANDPTTELFKNKRVTVMGLGLFGGGVAAARFMCEHGAHVTVTDTADEKKLKSSIEQLAGLPVTFHLAGHLDSDFTQADFVVASPAVPRDNQYLELARRNGACIETEMNLFFRFNTLPVIGITGSNGKSTTTTLTHLMLCNSGVRSVLGGNIGKPLLGDVRSIQRDYQFITLEMSSFQLEDLNTLKLSPHISIATNLTPNHLDRHKTFDAYSEAKRTITRWQTGCDYLVLNHDDPELMKWKKDTKAQIMEFSLREQVATGTWFDGSQLRATLGRRANEQFEILMRSDFLLPGNFNVANALGATCAALMAGATVEGIRKTLRTFKGVEHRLQLVHEAGGIKFYNDSIATTPESTIAAVSAIRSPVRLILGGYDKGIAFTTMAEAIASATHVPQVSLVGATRGAIRAELEKAGYRGLIIESVTLDRAVQDCIAQAMPGDSVVLSPACASYDQFINFIDRGNQFTNLAKQFQGR